MNPATFRRLAAVLAVTNLLGWTSTAVRADNDEVPPLNEPATADHNPGKIVWADLFTSDASAATNFYSGLFGWTATTIGHNGWSYTVMRNGGRPVAGIVQRPASKAGKAARWIEYIAVPDISAALAAASDAGGQVRARARSFPRRGVHAIIADNEGALIGLLQSQSGDPADVPSQPGDWTWFELFSREPAKSADFYGRVFAYQVAPDERPGKIAHYILSTGDYRRAGIAPVPNYPDAVPDWLGFIHVADIGATIARVSSLGGDVINQPAAPAYSSRYAIITDPTGGAIGLVQYMPDAKSNDATVPAGTSNPNP